MQPAGIQAAYINGKVFLKLFLLASCYSGNLCQVLDEYADYDAHGDDRCAVADDPFNLVDDAIAIEASEGCIEQDQSAVNTKPFHLDELLVFRCDGTS